MRSVRVVQRLAILERVSGRRAAKRKAKGNQWASLAVRFDFAIGPNLSAP